ncbi:MAG: NAD(P)H-dependent oxidoreductase [Clostridia bacterium]|nr:NAD(P)H-dependent oxidoreductase [Clostridia bacterium]
MTKKIGILVGSLRNGSFTRTVATQLAAQLPAGYEAKFLEIGQLPFYNEDIDTAEGAPEEYDAFRAELDGVDAVLLATPEYNRSYPAVIKNALDVGSRPYGHSKFAGKSALVVSVSPGAIGGFGANHHLRQVLVFLGMPVVQQPEAYIGSVHTLLDGDGKISNPETVAYFQTIVDAFVDLIERN